MATRAGAPALHPGGEGAWRGPRPPRLRAGQGVDREVRLPSQDTPKSPCPLLVPHGGAPALSEVTKDSSGRPWPWRLSLCVPHVPVALPLVTAALRGRKPAQGGQFPQPHSHSGWSRRSSSLPKPNSPGATPSPRRCGTRGEPGWARTAGSQAEAGGRSAPSVNQNVASVPTDHRPGHVSQPSEGGMGPCWQDPHLSRPAQPCLPRA